MIHVAQFDHDPWRLHITSISNWQENESGEKRSDLNVSSTMVSI
jgi:hypothetical protein